MSKKLIAIAAAAALALTGLVATPASAASFTVDIDASSNVTGHASSDVAVAAGDDNNTGTLDWRASDSTTRNVVRFVVNHAATTTITVNTDTGKLTESLLAADETTKLKNGAGSTSLSKAVTGSAAYTFYAYTNSTSAPAKITIATPTTTRTYWIKATVGAAYNLVNVKFPTTVLSGETNSNTNKNVVSFDITDQFGNAVTSGATATLSGVGASFSGAATYDSTRKKWEANVNGTSQKNVSMQVDLTVSADLSDFGFAAPVKYAFSSVSAGSLADQVTSLTAQVATLTASVTALTADYNKLANRFNKLQAAKKAPKKKVALK